MGLKYKLCDVRVGEITQSLWIPIRHARSGQIVHVRKEGVTTDKRPWNAANWDSGVVVSSGEAALGETLTDEQKAQVFEE